MMDREKVIGNIMILRTWCAVNPEYGMGLSVEDCKTAVVWLDDALALLKEQKPVVRCRDCKYWQDNNGGYPHEDCRWGHDETPDPDDYCSFGERRDSE